MQKIKYLIPMVFVSLLLVGCGQTPITSESNIDSSDDSVSSSSTSTSNRGYVYPDENPDAKVSTIQALVNKAATDNKNIYRITGVVQYPKNTRYGNFDIVDSTGYILVYGLSAFATCITKSSSTYSFSNQENFDVTQVHAGDTVTIEGLLTKYQQSSSYYVMEFQGYPTKRIDGGHGSVEAQNYTFAEPTDVSGTYYNGVSSKTGSDLEKSLQELMINTHTTYLSYSNLDSCYKTSDPSGTKIKGFYSGQAISSYNKEHVWPQSLSKDGQNQLYGTDHAGSDLHHIRPTVSSYNTARGNAMYSEIFGTSGYKTLSYTGSSNKIKYTANNFEPVDEIKGDCARIIMYVYVHYSTLIGSSKTADYMGNLYLSSVMGPASANECKNLLRKWNAMDQVSTDEITRNNVAFQKQGNRNPFIDHPTYADKIWG